MNKKITVLSILLISSLLSCNRENYDELFEQGIKHRYAREYNKAQEFYQKALLIKETAELYKELGNIALQQSQDVETATRFYHKALSIDAHYINAIHNLGMVYLRKYEWTPKKERNKKDLTESFRWLSKALKINNNFALSHRELGKFYYFKKKYNKSIAETEIAINLLPDDALNYLNLGEIYLFGLKKFKIAQEKLEISYSLSDKIPEVLKLLSLTYYKLKLKRKANSYYKRYINLLKDLKASKKLIKEEKNNQKRYFKR